jgi:dipeptidyl aminopeptidase/acylaminoacyl peptidase
MRRRPEFGPAAGDRLEHDRVAPARRLLLAVLFITQINCSPEAQAELSYSALQGQRWLVFAQSNEGARPRALKDDAGGDASAPSISATGAIAFESQGGTISACSKGRCETVRATTGSAVRPSWHPTTNELIFVNYVVDGSGEDSEIMITLDSLKRIGPLITQTGNQDDPDVSHDGRMLAYSSAQTISRYRGGVQVVRQLWVMDLETGDTRQLLLGKSQDIHPDWSPSGEQMAFASDRSGQFEIWIVNADGSGLHQVTSGEGAKTWPAWSPDGKSIMFTLANEGRMDLWIIDADGTKLRAFQPFGGSDIQTRDADWR